MSVELDVCNIPRRFYRGSRATTIAGLCGVPYHTSRFSQEFSRYTSDRFCDRCSVEAKDLGFGYYTCDQCDSKACARCASIQGQTNNNERPSNGRQASRTAKGRSGKQWTPNGPEVSHGSSVKVVRENTVNAAQPSSSSSWENLVRNLPLYDSDDHEQQKRAVKVVRENTVNAAQPSSSSSWENLVRNLPLYDSDDHEQQKRAVKVVRENTVNAAQPSSSSSWENLVRNLPLYDSDDHEQQKRAVNEVRSSHARPRARHLCNEDFSDEEEDFCEKQPVIPCPGSLGHELQFLHRSPYVIHGLYGCNMCRKGGSKDLYHCEICQFDTHKACAEIQEKVKVFFHKHPLQRVHIMYDEEFTCRFCVGDTEGDIRPWVYKCLTCPNFTVHARCAKYAKSLEHGSHRHTLQLVQNPVIGDSPGVCCDGCYNSIHQGYHYTCTEQRCDFDLHPSCAILPSAPLCPLNLTHRVKLDYMASETCHLCNSKDDEVFWMYRCTVCDVCMHIHCFNLELSDSDEELSDGDEEDEDLLGELYQKFPESMEDIGSQDNEEQVEKLSELVDSFKSNTKARSSLARQHSVKSSFYPKISTPAQSEVHVLPNKFAKMSLGDSSRSEVLKRDAEEEERRRAEHVAKEQKAEKKRDKAAWREDVASILHFLKSNFANQIHNNQCHQQAGINKVGIAQQVAELQARMENWMTSDAKRHQEQTKLLQERHSEYMSGLHEIIRTQVHSKTRAVPRLVLCSETTLTSRKLLTSLQVGLKGVRLDLLCEHAEQPHVVSGAAGCEINQKVAGDRWTSLQPFLATGVQIVTHFLAANVAGMDALSTVLPNLPEKVWNTDALDLGEHAIQTGRNKLVRKPEQVAEEAAADWLKFFLRGQNINIEETFKLHRVRYKSPDHVKGTVGWLCRDHLAKGIKDHVLDRFP